MTYAIRLRRLLSRARIPSRLIKVDNTAGGGGCSHGVEISREHLFQAVAIMRENGVEYSVHEVNR